MTTATLESQEKTARWVAAAHDLQPLVDTELPQAIARANTTDKVVAAWKDAGLYRYLLPAHLGGEDADLVTWINVMEEIAREDASTGWTYSVTTSGMIIAGIFLERDAYLELLGAERDGIACGFANGMPPGTAKKVDGGYLVRTDPMPFGSGTIHARRVITLLFLVDENDEKVLGEDGNPVVLTAYVDRAHVEWLDNWNSSGLSSTGSGHYRIREHVLEDKWFASFVGGDKLTDPIYGMGFWSIGIIPHVGVTLGICKHALEEVALAVKGKRRGAVPAVEEYPLFLYEFTRIEAEYQAARALVLQAYQQGWDAVLGGTWTELNLARIDQANHHLHRVADGIVSTATLWAGSAVIPKDGKLARLVADVRVAMNHLVADPQQYVKIAPQLLTAWQDAAAANA